MYISFHGRCTYYYGNTYALITQICGPDHGAEELDTWLGTSRAPGERTPLVADPELTRKGEGPRRAYDGVTLVFGPGEQDSPWALATLLARAELGALRLVFHSGLPELAWGLGAVLRAESRRRARRGERALVYTLEYCGSCQRELVALTRGLAVARLILAYAHRDRLAVPVGVKHCLYL